MSGGYAGKILRVDLSSGSITSSPTSDYTGRFLGGRGIAAKIYWDEVLPEVKSTDPENRLIFVTGPLGGFPGLAGSRWQVCGKSQVTDPEHFNYANLGGSWGAQLKSAGYDALVIEGRSERPVYLFVEDGKAEIKEGTHLWGKGALEVRKILKADLGKSVRVVACGPAGDNLVVSAILVADDDACGSGGLGAIMGSKRLKAVAVRGSGKMEAADPEKLREVRRYFHEMREGVPQVLVPRPEARRVHCHGCYWGCFRSVYEAKDGTSGKSMCHAGGFYQRRDSQEYVLPSAKSKSLKEWDEVPFFANRLCDDYGLDTQAVEVIYNWLTRCYQASILTDESIDIPVSKVGSLEFIETLVKKIALREGFGDLLAQGIARAAEALGKSAQELVSDLSCKGEKSTEYGPRMYITTGLFYAMEPRQPIQQLHEVCVMPILITMGLSTPEAARAYAKKFWGSEVAADFSTYEGKALAAKKIQDRQYAKECLILCDFQSSIWFLQQPEDHDDAAIQSKIFSAITGKKIDEEGLSRVGERVCNLQRAILAREGHEGRDRDMLSESFYTVPLERATHNPECLAPGPGGKVICKKGSVVDRERFEDLKDEYYQFRQWDVSSGLQTTEKLKQLDLQDVAQDLAKRGLAV